MNRSHAFLFDLQNGTRFIAKKLLIVPVVVSLVCFELELRQKEEILLQAQYAPTLPTLGDFALYLFGGMKPYVPNPDEPFLFPVAWFLIFGICLFLTLSYPIHDRETYGKMVVVYSGSRTKWWLAKCAWIFAATVLYFVWCWIVLVTDCLLYGGQFTFEISPYMRDIFQLSDAFPTEEWNMRNVLVLLPPLIAFSLGMLQMLLTLWFRPIICFLITAVLMLASAYFSVPVLIGNYALCIRSNEIFPGGFSFISGVGYAAILSLLCIWIGKQRFLKYDLY